MKRLTFLTALVFVSLFSLLYGCKKENDKVLNKITISGNTNTAINGDYIPSSGIYDAPYHAGCVVTLYNSSASISFSNGYRLNIQFYHPTTGTTIPTGTIQCQGHSECDPGFFAIFSLPLVKEGGYHMSGGTATIKITGDIYDVDLKFTIDVTDGGGKLTGNFNGTLTQGVN